MAVENNYVFKALVKDINQPIELMAYSLYKADKNEIAENLNNEQQNQPQIEADLQNFHDSVLNSPSLLQNYPTRARALGENLVEELKAGIKSHAQRGFIDRVNQLVMTEKSWFHYVGAFILDAVKGVASTVFVIIFFGGIYSLMISKDKRETLYSAAGKSLINVATGELPVIDNFRAEISKKKAEHLSAATEEQPDSPSNRP